MSEQTRLAERFWEKVDKTTTPDGCWLWTGCKRKGKSNYGYIGIQKEGEWKRKEAYRVSWELAHGRSIPEGKCVLHKCNNPPCVRPDHLELGTKSDNSKYAVQCGRWTQTKHGEDTWDAKLTWEKVREIRNIYASRGGPYRKGRVSERSLAAQFGVSRIAIRKVLSHQTWKE